jgi:uncharacterized protein (DUF427 family)
MLALEVVPLPVTDIDRALAFYAQHSDLGDTDWFTVKVGDRRVVHAAWRYASLPGYAGELRDRVPFAWRAMDAFYEEDERIVGHAADAYHRIDIRQSSRHLVVKDGVRPIADTKRPVVLYESGFAPRWHVPREDIDESALVPADGQTFSPYKGLASYYDIGDHKRAAWYYPQAWPEVARISNLVSFEPDEVDVFLDDKKLALEPGQSVTPHGIDRGLDPDEILKRGADPAGPWCFRFATTFWDPEPTGSERLAAAHEGDLAVMKSEIPDGRWIHVS